MKQLIEERKIVNVTRIICDVCGNHGDHECKYCKKDLCDSCLEWLQPNPLTNEHNITDYVDCVCKDCYREMERLSKTTIPLKVMYEEALEQAERKMIVRGNERSRQTS